jgi:hypothetical protein
MVARMAPLKQPIREKFCTIFASGKMAGFSQAEIYLMAGGKSRTQHSAEVTSSIWLKRPDIIARLAEIGAPSVRQTKQIQIDTENLLEKLETVFVGAKDDKQFVAATRAAELQGKLQGLMIDRSEVKATIGYDNCASPDDVISVVLAEMSAAEAIEDLKAMIGMIEERASSEAKPLNAVEPRDTVDRAALAAVRKRPQ